jgi:hypothetical protein
MAGASGARRTAGHFGRIATRLLVSQIVKWIDIFQDGEKMSSQSGDRCTDPKCAGRVRVRTSRRVGDTYERRLECNLCGREYGKQLAPAERVWTRNDS